LVKEFNYPEIVTSFNYEKHLSICTSEVVWDIEKGAILKLGP
jgi:hypothetical protein